LYPFTPNNKLAFGIINSSRAELSRPLPESRVWSEIMQSACDRILCQDKILVFKQERIEKVVFSTLSLVALFSLGPLLPQAPTLEGDASEILSALHTGGVIHSPGFSTYMTFLTLFAKAMPFFEVELLAALFRAVAAALGVGISYLIL
jgi:hypothetical protein